MVNVTINGRPIQVAKGVKILEAAKEAGFEIPTLCYFKELNEIGACRVCVVEVEGFERLVPACATVVEEGMSIRTDSARVSAARRVNLQLILSRHNTNCTTCVRSGNCKLQTLAAEFNLSDQPYQIELERNKRIDFSDAPFRRDADKCVQCLRCVQVCDKIQGMKVWDVVGSGSRTTIGVAGGRKLSETDCVYCGQCVSHCPTGALVARDDVSKALDFINDPEITTVVQIAPAVRASWADAFGLDATFATPKRMAAAFRRCGFDYVFDACFAADLTIMEEGSELVERLKKRGANGGVDSGDATAKYPTFTSCCPSWVRFIRSQYPETAGRLSSAKSPQQMFGAVAKSYFAEKRGIDPAKIRVISIMPCVAKKNEREIGTLRNDGKTPEVDLVLTTREATRLLRAQYIDPRNLAEEDFDDPLGRSTGAGVIFGAAGGVLDAALRSAYYLVSGQNPDADAFREIRGVRPWKEATYSIPGFGAVRVAAVSGLSNVRRLMEAVKKGSVEYDFVEAMACPGGCAGGGGQPIRDGIESAAVRGDSLWKLDADAKIRFSHENEAVLALYQEYLGAPGSEKAKRLLHADRRS